MLIVDDLDASRLLLKALLEGHGHAVQEARHGAQALAMACQHAPDLLISDLLMPVMDGYMLLRECKADPSLQRMPFIAYTANFTDPKDERLIDYGDARLQMMLGERGKGGHVRSELTLIRSDGSRFLADLAVTSYCDSLGRERISIIARDISASKRIEDELRNSLARLADLQAAINAHALLSMTDAQGRISFVNDLFCQVSGFSREELLGQNHRLVSSGLHPPEFFVQL